MSDRLRPTWVEVDLGAVRLQRPPLTPSTAALMAVVKGNGYGHGDVEVATSAVEAGARLGVALVEEGIRLREAGIDAPILVLSECPPGAEAAALAAGLTPTLYTLRGLARLRPPPAPPRAGAREGGHRDAPSGCIPARGHHRVPRPGRGGGADAGRAVHALRDRR